MTTSEAPPTATLPHADTPPSCPICHLPRLAKRRRYHLYGVNVCRKCCYRLANRRQGAFLLDYILLSIGQLIAMSAVMVLPMASSAMTAAGPLPPEPPLWIMLIATAMGVALLLLFGVRDGFRGRSPGKWIAGLQVLREDTFEPIGPGLSLKRNLPIVAPMVLVNLISLFEDTLLPVLAWLVIFIYLLIISQRMARGPRWGDEWAGTRVVWVRHAHKLPFDPRGRYCVHCAYDLTGNTSGVCPECGASVKEQSAAIAREA